MTDTRQKSTITSDLGAIERVLGSAVSLMADCANIHQELKSARQLAPNYRRALERIVPQTRRIAADLDAALCAAKGAPVADFQAEDIVNADDLEELSDIRWIDDAPNHPRWAPTVVPGSIVVDVSRADEIPRSLTGLITTELDDVEVKWTRESAFHIGDRLCVEYVAEVV